MRSLGRKFAGWTAATRDKLAGPALRLAEERAVLAQQRLRNAIDVLPEGIVFLDSEGRYVLWNQKYAELYHRSADLFAKGARLEDTLRIGVKRGDYPSAIGREEEWLNERLSMLRNPGMRHEQWLADGRCIMIEERVTADGDTIGLRVDITEMKRREESFRLLFESNPVPLFVYDPASELVFSANEAAANYFGFALAEMSNLPATRLFADENWHDARRMLATSSETVERFWALRCSDGTALESILFTRQTSYDGRPATIVSVFDVTKRRRAEARIVHMARHDALTGLANRTQFREALQKMLNAIGSDTSSMAVLMIDLDHFKSVNDSHGHLVGDALLAQAAERMCAIAEQGTLVARLGGDEFAMLVPPPMSPENVTAIAESLVLAMSEPFFVDGHILNIGATIGIAFSPSQARDEETVIRYADLALYAAKHEKRGSWAFFEAAMDVAAQEKRHLENDLRNAVRNGDLVVYYQPLMDLRSGLIEGYEALLRWNHPERGPISPAQFIPIAEETGLIDLIGQHVLQSACHEAMKWPAETKIAVNVSPVQFRSSNLLTITTQALARSGLSPSRLELEITEAVLIEKSPHVAATMHALRTLGVGIAMDDFGTGYSSLSYLLNYPFTKIKIDKSFVYRLDSQPNSQAIVRAIIGLGKSLGMTVTAEGIEQSEVLDYLREEGCAQGQGYLFGEARPGQEIVDGIETLSGQRRVA